MTKADPKPKRPPKKTDMLEVRVSPEEKAAFLDACRELGRSASSVIRDAMRAYASFGPMARLPGSSIMIISAFAGAALGAFALIQITQGVGTGPADRLYGMDEYSALDRDMDRRLSFDEYRRAEGSAREILVNARDGRPLSPARSGLVGGLLIGSGLDSLRFANAPESIGADCWAAVEAYFADYQDRQFNHWDQDGDRVVTPQEFSAVKLAQVRWRFLSADRNGDGLISNVDHGAPARQLDPALRSAAFPEGRLVGRPQDACLAEQELRRMLNPPSVDTEVARELMEQFRQDQYQVNDYDRNGAITFEEYLAIHS